MRSITEAVELLFDDLRTGIRVWPDADGNIKKVEILCEDAVVDDDHAKRRVGRVKLRAFAKRLLEVTALKAAPRPEPCDACLGTGWLDSLRGAKNPELREDCKACDGTGQQQERIEG